MNEELKVLSKEIIKQIPNGDEDGIESLREDLVVDGVKYSYNVTEELEIKDDGKYQFGSSIYGIGLLNTEKGYDIMGDVLFYIKQDFNRSGSYYSDYYYEYEKPYLVEQVTKVITTTEWEVIR